MKHHRAVACLALVLGAGSASADQVYVGPGMGLEVVFSLPAQPAAHTGYFMGQVSAQVVGTMVQASLYDEAGLLGTTTSEFIFPAFVDPSNPRAGQPSSVTIDFSRLADGTSQGRLVLTVVDVPGIISSFQVDPQQMFGTGFGAGGVTPGFEASILSVSTFVAVVPEPPAAAMGIAGLLVVAAARARVTRRTERVAAAK